MTTRMSQAHEITYTIYAALKGASDPKKTDKENPADENSMLSTGNKKLDESAPEITGLEYKDETSLSMQNTLNCIIMQKASPCLRLT